LDGSADEGERQIWLLQHQVVCEAKQTIPSLPRFSFLDLIALLNIRGIVDAAVQFDEQARTMVAEIVNQGTQSNLAPEVKARPVTDQVPECRFRARR
jgi:hypothetical protein